MNVEGLQRLSGRIDNLKVATTTVDDFITDVDRSALKGTAAATALAGSAGLGIGLLAVDANTSSEANLMTFDLEQPNGRRIKVQACVWQSPFKNGDEVEVVAEFVGGTWKGVAVARPLDRLVAVYPMCTHGRRAHWNKVAKWWWRVSAMVIVGSSICFFLVGYLTSGGEDVDYLVMTGIFSTAATLMAAILAVIAWRIGRKFGKLVPMSERIFGVFGWNDPRSVDLYATTKSKRCVDDPDSMGESYFRY